MDESSPNVGPRRSASGRPRSAQRRIVSVLVVGQILGGIGMGAALSIGSLLAVEVSGSTSWAGMAATMNTLGAALFAIPLARLAMRRGRRISLAQGSLIAGVGATIAVAAATLSNFPLLLVGFALLGAGAAVGFQARFAATDMAAPGRRARDLSIVIWSTTIGAVAGPNLVGVGESLGELFDLPPFTGAFVITVAAQLAAVLIYSVALRPEPLANTLATAKQSPPPRVSGYSVIRRRPAARFAVMAIALSHGTMVAVMSMAPVHLSAHGASLTIIGVTLSLHIAGMYGLSPAFGWLTDRAGQLTTLLIGQAMLLAALILAWTSPETTVTMALVLLGLGWSASMIAGSAMVAEAGEPHELPSLQGTSDFIMNITGAVCGAIAGPILSIVGFSGLGAAFIILVGFISLWGMIRIVTARRLARLQRR